MPTAAIAKAKECSIEVSTRMNKGQDGQEKQSIALCQEQRLDEANACQVLSCFFVISPRASRQDHAQIKPSVRKPNIPTGDI